MTAGASGDNPLIGLWSQHMRREYVRFYLITYDQFAASLASRAELPTVQKMGEEWQDKIRVARWAVENDIAGVAAASMIDVVGYKYRVDAEFGRLEAAERLSPERDPRGAGSVDVSELARMAQLKEEQVAQKADELASEQLSEQKRDAARKSKEPWKILREYAEEIYEEGTWKSCHAASWQILPTLRQRAEELGLRPSEGRFQKTVYDWLREYNKR